MQRHDTPAAEYRWYERRPLWAGHLAGALAAAASIIVAAQALSGGHDLVGLASWAWPGAAMLFVGAVAGVASVRPWGRHIPAILVTATLWLVAALTAAGSCFVLLNLIELAVTGSVTDRDGNSDWSTFVERLVGAVLAVLFLAAALSWHRRISGRCSRCGQTHPAGIGALEHPEPLPAPRGVRLTAYVGCLAFIPYLTLHALDMFVLPGGDSHYDLEGQFGGSLEVLFAVVAIGLVGPAVFLLLGLVGPWGMVFPRWTLLLAGRRVPRFLPLSPVFLVAPTLALYGIGSVPWAIATGEGRQLWSVAGAASLAFGTYGCALAVAAVSYYRRTRPHCVPAADGSTESSRTSSGGAGERAGHPPGG